ncbi:sucrose-6-phosphate hydrolase [Bacillus timonensis]|nr:sucrose-6-phosphate hydrolase [Bacillus timonensis]
MKHNELVQKANEEVQKQHNTVMSDDYRLHYHLMPPVGLINDPNGFIQWKGTYHLFYQWMPFKTGHGAKFWGHYTSPDLVNWTHEQIALTPSDWYDKNGCYSGSAISTKDELMLFYTGNVKDAEGNRETYQCLATSKDGLNFEKKGPVLELPEGYTAHFRDPKVWKKDDVYYMIIGAQSVDIKGHAALFQSSDLLNWELLGNIAGSTDENNMGYMWECPDLFELDGQDVLLFSPQGIDAQGMLYNNVYQCGYYIGKLDYESAKLSHGEFYELDRGFEFYAPQTTLDENGRRIVVGWMGVPDQNEDKHPTIAHKWIHCLTIPRVLHVRDGKLIQTPVVELEQMRGNEVSFGNVALVNELKELEGVSGEVLELKVEVEKLSGHFEMLIRDHARIVYNQTEGIFTLERHSFADGKTESRSCKLNELHSLRIYLDTSSIEIFVNDGEEVFTARIYPYKNCRKIAFGSKNEAVVSVTKWDLR